MSRLNFGTVKPSFIIIGVQKGGTSSLHQYLAQHPNLAAPALKELHFFDTQKETSIKDYLKYFPKEYFTKTKSFEATPRYIYFPGAAKKIYDFNPNLKLILVLRDPAKRAFSAWNMYRQMSTNEQRVAMAKAHQIENPHDRTYSFLYENPFPSFEEWVKIEMGKNFPSEVIEPSIVKRGYYKHQIENYLQYFRREQIHFLDFHTFKNNTLSSLNDIALFLEISDFNNLGINFEVSNQRAYTETLEPELYRSLLSHYQEKNEGLEELVNLKFNWMSQETNL